jgi:hypothetical protein
MNLLVFFINFENSFQIVYGSLEKNNGNKLENVNNIINITIEQKP